MFDVVGPFALTAYGAYAIVPAFAAKHMHIKSKESLLSDVCQSLPDRNEL